MKNAYTYNLRECVAAYEKARRDEQAAAAKKKAAGDAIRAVLDLFAADSITADGFTVSYSVHDQRRFSKELAIAAGVDLDAVAPFKAQTRLTVTC